VPVVPRNFRDLGYRETAHKKLFAESTAALESKSETEAANMNPMQIPDKLQDNYVQPNTQNPAPHPAVGVQPHLVGNVLEQQTEAENERK
jgi:hypothetical protein